MITWNFPWSPSSPIYPARCQRVGMPGLCSIDRFSAYCPRQRFKWLCSQHTFANQLPFLASTSRHLDSNIKGGCVYEERVLRCPQTGQVQLGLSCKGTKCSDTGTGDLGVLTTHETSPMEMTTIPISHMGWLHRSQSE